MVASPTSATPATAEALYRVVVWPALWAVLQLPAPAPTATTPPSPSPKNAAHERCVHNLQAVTTHALVQLLRSAAGAGTAKPGSTATAASLQEVTSQLLLHPHGSAPRSAFATAATAAAPTSVPVAQRGILDSPATPAPSAPAAAGVAPAAVAAAVEVERLFVLISTAVHLAAQSDIAPLLAPAGSESTGVADAASLPWGAGEASKAVAAAIFGVAACVAPPPPSSASPSTAGNTTMSSFGWQASAPRAVLPSVLGPATPPRSHTAGILASPASPPSSPSPVLPQTQQQATAACVQQLWLTFLFLYLQHMSAHTPKDPAPYARFLAACAEESRRRRAAAPVLVDSAQASAAAAAATRVSVGGVVPPSRHAAEANEAAALQAWGQVPAEVLRDVIGRTRFRRAALLFKSFVPHMPTQAPTLTFLLADLLLEFSRGWGALMHGIPRGLLAGDVAQRLGRYDPLGLVHGDSPARPSAQWRDCAALFRTYGDRLVKLLSAGAPHSQLVATALLTVLSSLYVLPYTRTGAPPTAAAAAAAGGTPATPPSPSSARGTNAGAAGGGGGKRDEEAAVLEVETALRLPHRAVMRGSASPPAAVAAAAAHGISTVAGTDDAVSVAEAEWRLRRYAPFGQLLAYARLLELQKVPLFSVATSQMRVGRSAAQQVEHSRLLALAACYCGVAGWDLTLLLYHFAECPLNAFAGPDSAPPALPSSALARYTAAVRQYVEQTRAELIVDMPFTEKRVRDGNGGGWSRARHGGRGSGYGLSASPDLMSLPVLPTPVTTTIPSRGELHTTRFMRMVHPDPLLLNWRLQLTATEALVATGVTTPPPASGVSATAAAAAAAASSTSAAGGGATAGASSGGGGAASPGAAAGGAVSGAHASSDVLLSPCCLVRDLIVAGHFELAVEALHHLAHPPPRPPCLREVTPAARSIDVLLLPRRAFPHGISVAYYVAVLLRRWLQRWDAAAVAERLGDGQPRPPPQLRDEVYHVLHALKPLLSAVQSYLANQSLLVRLLGRLAWLCSAAVADVDAPAPPTPQDVFALTEELLIAVVMPCLRVLPPAPAVYDAMQEVLHIFVDLSTPRSCSSSTATTRLLPYGDNAAMPLHVLAWLRALLPAPSMIAAYQTAQEQLAQGADHAAAAMSCVHPHDALLRKEREALLSQSLKRLNADNLDEYRALLRPILYAEPLLVAHRLFTQAVGYNNSFLALHVALLRGLPGAVLALMVQQGLLLMARYAAEEITDAGGESRVAILATFLATLWRDNTNVVDGAVLVRRAELALRGDGGADIILGTELCKALLAVMAHRTLEYEEKYNATQLQALAYAPSLTSLFGRGAMTSFRMRLWKDTAGSALLLLSPTDVLMAGRRALLAALQKLCHVPVREEHGSDENEGSSGGAEEDQDRAKRSTAPAGSCLTLGQHILVHFCRLQSRIYALQRDADGGAELILLSSAGRFNAINDMIVAVEEMLPAPASASVLQQVCAAVRHVGVPALASLVDMQLRRKLAHAVSPAAAAPGETAADAVYHVPVPLEGSDEEAAASGAGQPASVEDYLQHFTAAHFAFDAAPYVAARAEWQECMQRAQSAVRRGLQPGHGLSPATRRRSAALTTWLQAQEKRFDLEEAMHRRLFEGSVTARARLLTLLRRDLLPPATSTGSSVEADERLIDVAVSCLLPRALLNLREAATVAAFFAWLFDEATREAQTSPVLLRRATDLALTFVTAVFAHFVAFTDAECKRLGYVLQRLLQVPALDAYLQQHDAVAQLSPTLAAHVEALLSRGKGVAKAADGAAGDGGARAGTSGSRGGAVAGASGASREAQARASLLGAAALTATFLAPAPVSLLHLAADHGLVAPPASNAAASTVAAAAAASAAAEGAASAGAGMGSAIPWQLEAYMTRAMVQLLTHEQDVPAYALRNLFLVLEQVNKSTFPASLCAVDLLVRAVEPHASETKSYFASASAVLKLLRANRRQRREVQQSITALRRGDDLLAHNVTTASAANAAGPAASQQTRVAAAACHGQWRLDEHYMRQLLQEEVALLVEDARAHRNGADDDNDDDDVEEEEASDADATGEDREEEADDTANGTVMAAVDAAAASPASAEGEVDDSSVQTGGSDDDDEEESGSGSGSESDDGDADDAGVDSAFDSTDEQQHEEEGDDDDAGEESLEDGQAPPAARKRRLED